MIDWSEVALINALLGGMLIGVAASILILFNGKIAGISGIVGGLLRPKKNDVGWRVMFVLGLLFSPILYSVFRPLPAIRIEANITMIIIAGILVGIGTRYASGCTSGHGVCGIARLSPRSFLATISFIFAGVLTVFLVRLFSQ
jgi:uncharacterized membrane protein YedE/YeeE